MSEWKEMYSRARALQDSLSQGEFIYEPRDFDYLLIGVKMDDVPTLLGGLIDSANEEAVALAEWLADDMSTEMVQLQGMLIKQSNGVIKSAGLMNRRVGVIVPWRADKWTVSQKK